MHRILFRQKLVVCDGVHPRPGISGSYLFFKMYITDSVPFREIGRKEKILTQFIQGKEINLRITECGKIVYGKLNGRQELIQPFGILTGKVLLERKYILHICGGQ